MDESTSALDTRNERLLYAALRDAGRQGSRAGRRGGAAARCVRRWCGAAMQGKAAVLCRRVLQRQQLPHPSGTHPPLALPQQHARSCFGCNTRLTDCAAFSSPAAGITFISVGHRPTLTAFHDNVLLLHGNGSGIGDDGAAAAQGGWEVRPASELTLEKALDFMG